MLTKPNFDPKKKNSIFNCQFEKRRNTTNLKILWRFVEIEYEILFFMWYTERYFEKLAVFLEVKV